ncbi:MAG: alanine racemase [Alphaproteobacteria bacterium]
MPTPPELQSISRSASILTIDLGAVQSNYRHIAALAAGAECAAVVKADGYGLGALRVARALCAVGCRTFFVAHLDEAITLRGVLRDETIYCFNGLTPGEAPVFAEYRINPVLNDLGQVAAWARFCIDATAPPAALHLDTGMARLGLMPAEARRLAAEPDRLNGIDLALVMSHLACPDTPWHPLNQEQLALFTELTAPLPGSRRSLAASSGTFLGPAWHFDMVRPGAGLYGVSPNAGKPNPLRQVVSLKGKILSVRIVDTPQTVGYGATRRFTKPTMVATVAAGYADGYPRSLGNEGSALLGDTTVPVIGRVSMDLITLDVSNVPNVTPGDFVDLICPRHDIDALAAEAGTIGYEILTRLGHRYHRAYIEGDA